MKFNEKLKNLRKEKGLTQEQLGDILMVSRSTIAKWENDLGYPDIVSFKLISKYFHKTIDELVTEEDDIAIRKEINKKEILKKVSIIALSVLVAVGIFFCIFSFCMYNAFTAKNETLPWFIASVVFTSLILISAFVVLFTSKELRRTGLIFSTSLGLSVGAVLVFISLMSLLRLTTNDPPAWIILIIGVVMLCFGIGSLLFLLKFKKEQK